MVFSGSRFYSFRKEKGGITVSLRERFAEKIAERLRAEKKSLKSEFQIPGRIPSFTVDDLLEKEWAEKIRAVFPEKEQMCLRDTYRERKYVAAQMDHYNGLLEEIVFAFQSPLVVKEISEITGLKELLPDEKLYAGGISLMSQGDFLNPHLDNSHDHERKNYRVINLLYYVSPDWKEENGGNLELWDQGPGKPGRTLMSRFNRLAVMMTGPDSWHSVSKVTAAAARCCVSNYYFSPHPAQEGDYFHVTSFRGRPEEKFKDFVLRCDNAARNFLRIFFKKGMIKTFHIYQRPQ